LFIPSAFANTACVSFFWTGSSCHSGSFCPRAPTFNASSNPAGSADRSAADAAARDDQKAIIERPTMRGIANVTLMALLTAVAGCTRPVAIEGKEVAQEIDFYAELKALVMKDSAGAHKTDVYRVYVAPSPMMRAQRKSYARTVATGLPWTGSTKTR
jgi:hypothetical protein